MTRHYNRESEKQKRRTLRQNATDAEQILWRHLRRKQLGGFKFKRQYSIDQFIIDFYCPELELAIEVDGPTHFTDEAQEYDANREEHIKTFGVTFVRVTNNDVYENIDGVLMVILEKLQELRESKEPPPDPLLTKEGGQNFSPLRKGGLRGVKEGSSDADKGGPQ